MEKKKVELFDIIAGLAIILTVAGCIYYIVLGSKNKTQTIKEKSENTKNINEQLGRVEELLYRLDDEYLYDVDYEKLGSGALAGIMAMVDDPYTRYLTKEAIEKELIPDDSNYVGIGITARYIETDEILGGELVAITPDSPAANGGLWIGDILVGVNENKIVDEDSYKAVMNELRGEVDQSVKVIVNRDGEELEISLVRKEITSKNVTSNIIDDDIGYIRIYQFEFHTYSEFEKIYNDFEKRGIKKLIIDLRNNGGGIVDESTKIVDLLSVDGELLLKTKYKNGDEKIEKTKDGKQTNMDVIVLVNGNSASASEIMASSLRDLGTAKLMGEKTYGKGIVQNYERLSGGDGTSITVAEYFTKSGITIHKTGIEPDYNFVGTDLEKRLIVSTKENDSMIKEAVNILNK